MKLLLKIKYDGTAYAGYQVQRNALTIQEVLNSAANDLFGHRCDITGCSRTDAGVHATCFCVTVQKSGDDGDVTKIPITKIPYALNARLPDDISVVDSAWVNDDFHARYSVISKTYEYKILNAEQRDPFMYNRAYHFPKPIGNHQIEMMQTAADLLCGTNDFASFMASGSKIVDTVRTVYSCNITKNDDIILIKVSANGFLYNMVRIICGTLLDVARGVIAPDDISKILQSRDRNAAGATLPAHGLYLTDVCYPFDPFLDERRCDRK